MPAHARWQLVRGDRTFWGGLTLPTLSSDERRRRVPFLTVPDSPGRETETEIAICSILSGTLPSLSYGASAASVLGDFVSGVFVVTESSTGPRKRLREMNVALLFVTLYFVEYISQNRSHPQGPKSEFKEVTAAHVGCHGSGFPGSFLSRALSSYGASVVTRTSGRGHVAEV
jgi:hypothetical protein